MLVIPLTFDSESSNLNFEVFRLTFANFTRLTAVKARAGIWPHIERGYGFWHLFGSRRSGYMTDPSTVSS